jgi:phosphohistidine phosphatase
MPEKLVCFMRHSEAVAQLSDVITRDFDKPLTDHGIHQLEHVRDFLKTHHFLPDLILCSAAVRTRQTLEWIHEALGTESEVVFDEGLYGINADGLLRKLSDLSNNKSTVLVVGHNPAISEVMQILLNLANVAEASVSLPAKPSQLALFRLHTADWMTLTTEKAVLEASYEPEH